MSSVINVTITLPSATDTIAQSKNSIFQLDNLGDVVSDQFSVINNLCNLLTGAMGGTKSAQVQITVRDTDPSVTTSGSGSVQVTYNLK